MDIKYNKTDSTNLDEIETEVSTRNKKDPFFCYRVLKQLCLVGTWMSMAMNLEVVGPCIPDLKEKIGLNYEEMSRAMVGTSVGLIIAAIIGGIIHERYYRFTDLFMSIGLIIGSIGVILLPWMNTIWSLALAFFCCGFEVSLNNPGGNAMVMHLWGEKSGSPMYSLHFGFGLGALLAPQIAKSFLINEGNNYHNMTNTNNYTGELDTSGYYINNGTILPNQTYEKMENPYLAIPFTIVGLINIIFAIFFFIFFLIGPPRGFPQRKGAENFKTLCLPRSCAPESNLYSVGLLGLLFFFYIHVVGGEHIYGKWIFSYALETDVNFTKDQAANLLSLYWFCHMTGRGSGMVFSKFVPTKIVLLCDILAAIVVALILSIFGHKIPLLLWIFTACMGLLVAPLFPAGMLWTNIYMNVNSMTVMTCMLGGSAGYMLYVYLGGYILEYVGARYMMFVELFYGLASLATLAALEIIVRCFSFKHEKHYKEDKDETCKELPELEGMLTIN